MPYTSHHFVGKERSTEVPPWGSIPPGSKGGQLTSYNRTFQGQKGLPSTLIRNHTSNHFEPQTWRDKSSYQEQYFTPNLYSRHQIIKASVNRSHRPHPSNIVWPLEPYKGYMIWKPKMNTIQSDKPYTAPNLIKHFYQEKWKTTTQAAYQNQNLNVKKVNEKKDSKNLSSINEQQTESRVGSRDGSRAGTRVSQCKERYITPHLLNTVYQKSFVGEKARPSTNARPVDYSWRNIKY